MFNLSKKKQAAISEKDYHKRMLDSYANTLAVAYNMKSSFEFWEIEQFSEDLAAIDYHMKELDFSEYTYNGLYFIQCPIYKCVIVKGLK